MAVAVKVAVALGLAVGEAVAVRGGAVGLADRSVRRAIKVEMWPGAAVTGAKRGLGIGVGGSGWQAASAATTTMPMAPAAARRPTESHDDVCIEAVMRAV